MSVPLILISKFKVKEGKANDLKAYYKRLVQLVAENEPQFIAFHGFMNEDETEMTSVQVHADVTSMDFHMQVINDNWDEISQFSDMVDAVSTAYYGEAPQSALSLSEDILSERNIILQPLHLDGFTRSSAKKLETS